MFNIKLDNTYLISLLSKTKRGIPNEFGIASFSFSHKKKFIII